MLILYIVRTADHTRDSSNVHGSLESRDPIYLDDIARFAGLAMCDSIPALDTQLRVGILTMG